MDALFRLAGGLRRDAAVQAWFEITDPSRIIVRPWFERVRASGGDVRELIHDGCPTACVGDAAFAYVNAFSGHAAVGFYNGAALPDPAGLLQGSGKRMRHVKLKLNEDIDEDALSTLIADAYADVRRRMTQSSTA
ncbi:MAG: DUF1801 domain-containing protein [Sphingomonas sp.]|nr:DUF1801 domain-containing protein [Sphingomonas sp.]MBW0006890.1 DUF1801 domain-containing protein [Sphingomonas sp.]